MTHLDALFGKSLHVRALGGSFRKQRHKSTCDMAAVRLGSATRGPTRVPGNLRPVLTFDGLEATPAPNTFDAGDSRAAGSGNVRMRSRARVGRGALPAHIALTRQSARGRKTAITIASAFDRASRIFAAADGGVRSSLGTERWLEKPTRYRATLGLSARIVIARIVSDRIANGFAKQFEMAAM
jgi:hypothetical protein